MQLTRVRGVPGGAFCGPRPEARPLGVIRRHFLLKGYEHGVGGLSTVELLVCHPLQLLGREMHVLMQVLVLLGSPRPRCFISNSSAFSLSAHRA